VNDTLHPEAQHDLRAAAEFYRERGGGALAQSLLAEFERSVNLQLQHPQLGALWRHGKRRLIVQHFPYSIVDAVAADDIRLLAVAHQSRRPGYWRGRK